MTLLQIGHIDGLYDLEYIQLGEEQNIDLTVPGYSTDRLSIIYALHATGHGLFIFLQNIHAFNMKYEIFIKVIIRNKVISLFEVFLGYELRFPIVCPYPNETMYIHCYIYFYDGCSLVGGWAFDLNFSGTVSFSGLPCSASSPI